MIALSEEQKKRYSSAIRHGFMSADGFDPKTLHSFTTTWVRKHPNRITTLVRLRDIVGHNPTWEDISDDTLSDLKDDMELTMAPNSVKTICAELKAVLNKNKASKPIKSETFGQLLKHKSVDTHNVYLTKKELTLLHDYKPCNEREGFIRDMFLLEAVTGARNVDCRALTRDNIVEEDGRRMIVYVAKKNNATVHVPVHPWADEIIGKTYSAKAKGAPSHFCEGLKWICFKCGIRSRTMIIRGGQQHYGEKWQFVGSHTGRRTFATYLSLRGMSIETISRMMGHRSGKVPNLAMTAGYIMAEPKLKESDYKLFKV